MVALTRFLTDEERERINADAIPRGYYRDDHRIMLPGWGWYEPWYWDPAKAVELGVSTWEEYRAKYPREDDFYGGSLLSSYYWQTWSKIRPPICVVLPDGEHWEIDRKSSNGNGWTVSGSWPLLSCTPSIAAKGYHGFLGSNGAPPGQFTKHLDGPQINGVYPYPNQWVRRVPVDPAEPRRIRVETLDGNPPLDYSEEKPPEGWIYVV